KGATANGSFSVTLTGANEAPVLNGDRTASLAEGGIYVITAADLGYSDTDDDDAGVTFSASSFTNGTLIVHGAPSSSFTGTQLAAGQVAFKHDGSETTSASFQVNVEDGNEDSSSPINFTFNVTIIPVDDAFTDEDELLTTPQGTTLHGYLMSGTVPSTDEGTIQLVEINGQALNTLAPSTNPDYPVTGGYRQLSLLHGTSPAGNLYIKADGIFAYTPTPDFTGSISVGYALNDGTGANVSSTLQILVQRAELTVKPVTVNEGSPHAVFRISGTAGQEIQLALETTGTGSGHAQIGSTSTDDVKPSLETFDGLRWRPYEPGTTVTYPTGSTTMLVRAEIINDTLNEGLETFRIRASSVNQGAPLVSYGIATLGDDGRGPIYTQSGSENPTSIKDDDRGLKVNSIVINEASPYAVFTLKKDNIAAGLSLKLKSIESASSALLDNGSNNANRDTERATGAASGLEVYTSLTNSWSTYNAGSLVGAGADSLFVRTRIRNDSTAEGSEHFELWATQIYNGTELHCVGNGTIRDDGRGEIFTGGINQPGNTAATDPTAALDDDFDRDGIAPEIEEILATMSASTGNGGSIGDLNNDGIHDSAQAAVANLAWISAEKYLKGMMGLLTEVQPIISVAALSGSTGNSVSSNLQLQAIEVLDEGSTDLDGGSKPSGGVIVHASWDAIRFNVTNANSNKPLENEDIDPSRVGTQIRIDIDISRAGVTTEDFNAYYKYVSENAINSYRAANISLTDLDKNPITEKGWYDFTQRTPGGDGARFITNGNFITGIEIILTDNSFGDNDPTTGKINDP
ncbi:MAG: cadherin-like domain-containing protein, partial [Chitinophagaceae bacterium]|nr:cadherin-like domain-containing protein [Chitinophagaceae bacterium]